jgi:hypothetical protein
MAVTRHAFCNNIWCDAAADLPAAGQFVGQVAWVNDTVALIKRWNGSAWIDVTPTFIGSGTLSRVGQLDIVNSAAEETLYTVSLDPIVVNRSYRLNLTYDYLNNSGAVRDLTLRVKLGSTTMYDDTIVSIPVSATRHIGSLQIDIGPAGSTSAQIFFGFIYMTNVGATTAGVGDLTANATFFSQQYGGTAAEDWTSAKTFAVTLQHSAANANLSFRRQFASLTAF